MPSTAPAADSGMVKRGSSRLDQDSRTAAPRRNRRLLCCTVSIRPGSGATLEDRQRPVRRRESAPGEVAEVDFGRLGLFQELGSRRPRMLWAFIMTMGYSRLSCVVPTFTQDLKSV